MLPSLLREISTSLCSQSRAKMKMKTVSHLSPLPTPLLSGTAQILSDHRPPSLQRSLISRLPILLLTYVLSQTHPSSPLRPPLLYRGGSLPPPGHRTHHPTRSKSPPSRPPLIEAKSDDVLSARSLAIINRLAHLCHAIDAARRGIRKVSAHNSSVMVSDEPRGSGPRDTAPDPAPM